MRVEQTKYVLVTPVRDEEEFLPYTVRSVANQTILPQEWVIVNDGSKDGTGELIEQFAREYPWIRPFHRVDRGFRKPGAGIIEAFYDGFNALTCSDWDFMCKLDGDLSFAPDYFEQTFERFRNNPRMGIGGGTLFHTENGVKQIEHCPEFHVRGGAKIFRRECWDAIGGLWVGFGSDTIDEVKANMLGWTSRSFRDLEMHHHRFTGAAYGKWGSLVKNGRGDYAAGYHPLFLLAKSVRHLIDYPYGWGSLALVYGYVNSYLKRFPRVEDRRYIRYIRGQQLARLVGRPTIWK